ncbi:MAG: GMC oxidoreductase [Actinomycetota bacterium]|nr:GMC oxidoreductase [Actinomycetota bacterium]
MAGSYDVVVIGSGFGGAVVAARLAEAGRSVCLLERGRRWEPADYPRSFSQAERAVWDEARNYGFLDYRVFRRLDVVQGSGVGGGSLHYFNVALRAPPPVFDRPEWPAAVTSEVLGPYYERVGAMIEARPLEAPAGERVPARTRAFLVAAERAGYDAHLVPIAVHTGPTRAHPVSGLTQEPCAYTADCLLGCRPRSKNSLDVTYLPWGEGKGLEIRPLHVAERIEAFDDGYQVTSRRLDPDRPGSSERCRVRGHNLVLAAGTLGTSELLLTARDTHRTLPRLPPTLGRRFSPNGDMIFAGTLDADTPVDPSHGPSITAGAFVQPPGSSHLIHVQDLGYPPAFTSLADGSVPTGKRLRSTLGAATSYVRAARGGPPFRGALLFGGSFVPHCLPYLGMGTDAADGRFSLDRHGQLSLDWNPIASKPMFDEMEAAMRRLSGALGGDFMRSPPWRLPFRRLLTAHPLGGCVMSDSPHRGVVDHRGQVWGHPGLFVADGSVVPGPLAVNPSLTIAALAERTAHWMVHGREA